jgi:hypothetical protein
VFTDEECPTEGLETNKLAGITKENLSGPEVMSRLLFGGIK